MKYAKLCIGCTLLFFASLASAKQLTKEWKEQIVRELSGANLLDIWVAPSSPSQPDKFSIFVRPTTSFQAPEEVRLVLNARLDGQSVGMQSNTEGLWWYQQSNLPSIGSHQFSVDYILENKEETDNIRANITGLQKDIKDLEAQIAVEVDQQKLEDLRAQLEDLLAQEENLKNSIADYQLLVKTESLQFQVN